MGLFNPKSWSKEGLAQWTHDKLDPIYGEGGIFEPVTVIIDPDRTVYEEYIEPKVVDPIVEYRDQYFEPVTDTAKDVALGLGVVALFFLFRR
jgi:hypothetical protein